MFEIKGLGYVTEAIEPENAHEQAIAVLTLLAGNSREKNYPKTQEHYTFYKDKRFTSDVQQYFFDADRDLHYSFLGTRAFSSLALRGLHIINEATEHDAVKLSFLIDEYTKVVAPDTDKKTEIALGILETTTNLGVSTSYERNLSQNAAWIVVQDYMQLRGLGKEETELMFSAGLRNVVRNWVKHEYVNPYCLNSINDFLWDNAAHGGLYALRETYERAESNRGPSHYEVVDPAFVRRWRHHVEDKGGLRFLIKDRADRETGMGQEAVKRYDPNYPEVYLRDKAKHDELLALAGARLATSLLSSEQGGSSTGRCSSLT